MAALHTPLGKVSYTPKSMLKARMCIHLQRDLGNTLCCSIERSRATSLEGPKKMTKCKRWEALETGHIAVWWQQKTQKVISE